MGAWSPVKSRVLALILAAGTSGVAHAADANGCFTPVGGIDGTDPDISVIGNGVNDARWNGGFGYGWETGGLGEGEYKAISDPTNHMVYVSWRHPILKNQIAGYEGVQVGFGYTPPGSTTGQVSQIVRVTFGALPDDTFSSPTPVNADGTINGQPPLNVQLFYKVGTGAMTPWKTTDVSPAGALKWAYDATRMYILTDATLVSTANPTGLYYVVQMAIPTKGAPEANPALSTSKWLTPGVYFTPGAPIPYWADILEALDPTTATVIFRSWPDPGLSDPTTPNYGKQNRDVSASGVLGVPDPAHWSTMEEGSPRDGTCSGTGLTFKNTDIQNLSAIAAGSWDGNLLTYKDSGGAIVPQDNFFSVQVTNSSTTPYKPADISASFSIAPYGSQAGARTAAWAPLNTGGNALKCTGTGSSKKCSTTPGVQITASSTSTTTVANGAFTLDTTSTWKPDRSYLCAVVDQTGTPYDQYPDFVSSNYCASAPWTPAAQDPTQSTTTWDGLPFHTCMQVELSTNGSSSGGVTFANKSAFRNMYAVPASLYREQAIIDTRGLPKIKGTAGHYIYLYTETRNMPYTVTDPSIPQAGVKLASNIGIFSREGAPTYDQIAKVMPTMAVHTYWDTGKTTTINKKKLAVLEPMSSYGNFVTHDYQKEGAVYGWDAHLEGATQVGPHTYRVYVPNEGRVSVTTSIEALPSPRCSSAAKPDVVALLQSLAPILTASTKEAQEIKALLALAKVQCVDLYKALDAVAAANWGIWNSWVQLLVTEIKAASGCNC